MKNTADNIYETNKIIIAGQIQSPLKFSHKTYGEAFYIFELGVERRSGYVDEINVMISERLIYETPLKTGDFVEITGQVRTYNEMMIAVNRMYNKSDYIPCIAWGRNANYADTMGVGTRIYIEGRIQSREYKKKLSDGTSEMRKAFEVSVLKLEEAGEEAMEEFSEEAWAEEEDGGLWSKD